MQQELLRIFNIFFRLAFLVFQITYEIFHGNIGSAKIQPLNLFLKICSMFTATWF